MTETTVLYVDPDEAARERTLDDLRRTVPGLRLLSAPSCDAAMDLLADHDLDCVVTEHELPDGTGLDLASALRTRSPSTACILYTDADRSAIERGADEDVVVEYVDSDAPDAGEQLARLVEVTTRHHAQTAYPLPQAESERLDVLETYDLDTDALQADLSRLTDLASAYFDVPMASVNIIEERSQEFLACHGGDWSATTREDSICTYAIVEGDGVTVIEDVQSDPRFADNEELQELGIRSYAGATLTTDDGLAIGTLCVYDDEPRSFSSEAVAYLDSLSEVVMRFVELHQEVGTLCNGAEADDEADESAGGDG
jgi:CheY-like chemotaxis protein